MDGQRIIPLVDSRDWLARLPLDIPPSAAGEPWTDSLNRPLRDLRISVTDRCNFRCRYCMPRELFDASHAFLPRSALLSFEEIHRIARVAVAHGVRKLRLTGGEPLLRKGLDQLIAQLASLRTPDGDAIDLTLTTNGSLLARQAPALQQAGLRRLSVSLDALDEAVFKRMNDADHPVSLVLGGIEAAQRVGLGPIKVNMVVKRGTNDDQVLPMARHFRNTGIALRFIEYMDVGGTHQWNLAEVLPSSELLARLQQEFELEPLARAFPGDTATRWRYRDGGGEVGFISSVTQAFCRDCNRARLSPEGRLFLCLFAHQGHDLRQLLRSGKDDAALSAALGQLWAAREDRYSELRSAEPPAPARSASARVPMHYIGG